MIRKSLTVFLLVVAAGTAGYAQKDITPPPAKPDVPQTFAWSFNGDGGYLGREGAGRRLEVQCLDNTRGQVVSSSQVDVGVHTLNREAACLKGVSSDQVRCRDKESRRRLVHRGRS